MGEQTTARLPVRDLRAGLLTAGVVALAWTAALAVVELRWGEQMYAQAAAAGAAELLERPYFLEHWPWVLQQGTRVLVAGAFVAALVHHGRARLAAALALALVVLGPLTYASPVLGPFAPGPGDSLVVGLWADAGGLLVALALPAAVVLRVRRAGSTAPALERPPVTATLRCVVLACAVGTAAALAPQAGSVVVGGISPETWSSLATLTVVVCATTFLVSDAQRPWRPTGLLLLAGALVSLTSSVVDTRADTVLSGAVLVLGPAVVLLGPAARVAWRRAFRRGPALPLGAARTAAPA